MLRTGLQLKILPALLLVLISSIVFSGCVFNRTVVLHPIEKSDFFSMPDGSKVHSPEGLVLSVEKDGWFLSDLYLEEVARARAGK